MANNEEEVFKVCYFDGVLEEFSLGVAASKSFNELLKQKIKFIPIGFNDFLEGIRTS